MGLNVLSLSEVELLLFVAPKIASRVKISHYIQPSNISSALVTIGKRSVNKKENETFLFDRMLVRVVQVVTLVVVKYFSFSYVLFSLLKLLVSVAFAKAFKMTIVFAFEVK